ILEAANRDVDQTGPRRVLAVDPAAAGRAEMPGVDVAAFRRRAVARRLSRDGHVVALEARERHVAGAGRVLAVLAVALPHADRFRTDRVAYGAAETAPRRKHLFRHDLPRRLSSGRSNKRNWPHVRNLGWIDAGGKPICLLWPATPPTRVLGSASSARPGGCASAR